MRLWCLLASTVAALLLPLDVAAAPKRVVSMNLCTDQLAMMIAGPGQLHSVSHLATDPESSAMVEEARKYTVNHGLAEEIFMMRPDLVLAGTFTSRATVAMLRRLAFEVVEFAPTYSFEEIREQMRQMGQLLGQPERAAALVAEFDRRLAAARAAPQDRRPLAATYYANSYTTGSNTLSNEVVKSAGLDNLAERLGLVGTARMPLEVLVMAAPEMLIGSRTYDKSPALAYETFEHPALRSLLKGRGITAIPETYWVCGTPATAEAVRILAQQAAKHVAGDRPRP